MAENGSKHWLVLIAFAWVLMLSGAAQAQSTATLKKQLTETIAQVRTGATIGDRTEAALYLADLTHGVNPNEVDDETLSALVSLLDTSEDSVRGGVTASLGNLGARAKIAVPKLQKLLPEAECLQGSLTSAGAIRLALIRMGVAGATYGVWV